MSEIKTSRLSRIAKLGTSLMKVGADLAMDKVKNVRKDVNDATHRISAAKEIIESMGQLKGGLMKIGQMISITEDLLLPPEIVSLFESLQKHAPPMSEQQMLSVFQEEFGKLPEEVFAYFNRVPMASASIGQVHHAMTIDGEKVAVKIQYPKIVKAITGDLKNLDQIDKLFSLLLPGKPHIRPMLEEIKESLVEECDYQHEMARMVLFRDIYANSFPDIHVPKTYPELSTSRVLTTEYIHGDPFEETLHYPQEVKDKLGSMLYNSFLYSLFEKGALHTDPQNGNYLFSHDKIYLLDFGSTRKFPKDFLHYYALICESVLNESRELYTYAAKGLEIFNGNEDEEFIEKTFQLTKSVYHPFSEPGSYPIKDLNPFKLLAHFISTIDISGRRAPRNEFLLLDRANIGLFTKLKAWGSHVDWHQGRVTYQYPKTMEAFEEVEGFEELTEDFKNKI